MKVYFHIFLFCALLRFSKYYVKSQYTTIFALSNTYETKQVEAKLGRRRNQTMLETRGSLSSHLEAQVSAVPVAHISCTELR